MRKAISLALLIGLLALAGIALAQQIQSFTIGQVEYFGYQGLDLARIEKAVPFHAGQRLSMQSMRDAFARTADVVEKLTGKPPTDVQPVCCDMRGEWYVYIGLPGKSSHAVAYNPPPAGHATLPANIVALYDQTMVLLLHAMRTGAKEDDSRGYFLSDDPGLRQKQLAMRRYALAHTPAIIKVLETSSDPHQRQAAANALGYGAQSPAQVKALAQASRDSDPAVRNNSVRALVLLARLGPKVASEIPPKSFVGLLSSGSWTDRNKGCALVEVLTRFRDPKLLATLRTQSMAPLEEMARWDPGHAAAALFVLGRIAGIPGPKLDQMVKNGQAHAIIQAAMSSTHGAR